MKINGRVVKNPNVEILVLPRDEGDLVFKATAILDYKEFDQLIPRPKPPKIRRRGEMEEDDFTNDIFKKELDDYGTKKTDWIVIRSLEGSDLEWDKVKLEAPDTWKFWREELKEAGLCEAEIMRVATAVFVANALNETKIEEARNRFLQDRAKASGE